MSELAVVKRELVEVDGRQAGEVYYQVAYHLGTHALALLAREPHETRVIPIQPEQVADALVHPEVYLADPGTIYGIGPDAIKIEGV